MREIIIIIMNNSREITQTIPTWLSGKKLEAKEDAFAAASLSCCSGVGPAGAGGGAGEAISKFNIIKKSLLKKILRYCC